MKKKKGVWIKILFLIIIVAGGYFGYKHFFENSEIRVVSSIEDYSYQLESNQTKIFKKYYKELQKELGDDRIDEENYAKLIVKLFVIDFYTLSNKVTNQDIGGVQFVHSSIQENFKEKATDTLYKYLKSNVYGNRRQELPTVKDVKIVDVRHFSYEYGQEKDDDAFEIQVEIDYKKDLGYDKEKTLVLVHEDRKLSLVEMK